jgi:hypothetical protein
MKASIIFDEHDNIVSIAKAVDLKGRPASFPAQACFPEKGSARSIWNWPRTFTKCLFGTFTGISASTKPKVSW